MENELITASTTDCKNLITDETEVLERQNEKKPKRTGELDSAVIPRIGDIYRSSAFKNRKKRLHKITVANAKAKFLRQLSKKILKRFP